MSCNTREIPATSTHGRDLRPRGRGAGRGDDNTFGAASPTRGGAMGAVAALGSRWIARADLLADNPYARLGGLVACLGSAFAALYMLAYLLRWEGEVPSSAWKTALATLPLVVGLKTAACILMGCHSMQKTVIFLNFL